MKVTVKTELMLLLLQSTMDIAHCLVVIFVDCLPLLKPFFANIDNLEISISGVVKRVSFICTCYNVNVSWVFQNLIMFFPS